MSTRIRGGALALAALLVVSLAAPAVAAVTINTGADAYPTTYAQEDELTKITHEMDTMDTLEYESNDGNVVDLEAIHNGTESGNDVAIRADRIAESDFNQFARTESEENNSETWTNASEWSTSGVTVSETDGSTGEGVESLTFSTSSNTGTATATYSVSETTDPNKRVLQLIGNVEQLDSGATVEIVLQDGDGDEVTPSINSTQDGTAADVITNSTANGVIYQQRVGDLSVQGSGDGSFDGIQKVIVRVSDADAELKITALNAERKSMWAFGTHRYEDADGEWTSETVEQRSEGGYINITSADSMGETFDDATISRLKVHNVWYRLQDQPDDYSAEIVDADNIGGYPSKLVLEGRINVETAYELSHGELELVTEQSLAGERYQRLRYAEGVGDTATSEISDSSWVDASGDLGEQGNTITLDATGQSGTTYVVQVTPTLLDGEVSELQNTGGGGFWNSDGGGNPFTSAYNWIVGSVVGLLTTLGLIKRGG